MNFYNWDINPLKRDFLVEMLTQPQRPPLPWHLGVTALWTCLCPENSGGIVCLGTGLGPGGGCFGTDIRAGEVKYRLHLRA